MNFESLAVFYDDFILGGWTFTVTNSVWEMRHPAGHGFRYDFVCNEYRQRMPAKFAHEFLKWYGKNVQEQY